MAAPRPAIRRLSTTFLAALIALGAWAAPAPAQEKAPAQQKASTQQNAPAKPDVTTDKLRKTRQELNKARREAEQLKSKAQNLEQDIVRIRDGLVAAARIIQHHELRIAEIQDRIDTVDATQVRIRKTFVQRRRQLGAVLAALQRMARNPPEALVAQPVSPADTVRSAILLRATLPRLEGEARSLRLDLETLAQARQEAEQRRLEFDQEMNKLEGQRVVLQRLLGRKSRLRRRTVLQTTRAQKRTQALSQEAASLLDLVKRLDALRVQREAAARIVAEQERKRLAQARTAPGAARMAALPKPRLAPPQGYSGKPFESGKGKLLFPAVGRVAAQYGQTIAKGRTHKGLTLETARSAQVIAPFEGKVAFSGPFKGYGQLLIIEHSGGYHTLLAGMARIDVAVGQWVLIGEPVGIMGRTGARKPALYLEIRRKGQPINPLPWLAARKGKVSG